MLDNGWICMAEKLHIIEAIKPAEQMVNMEWSRAALPSNPSQLIQEMFAGIEYILWLKTTFDYFKCGILKINIK